MPKPILFIDFNGVLSLKPFWFSLTEPDHELHKYHSQIQDLLFGNDMSVIQSWMLGEMTSEKVHEYIGRSLGIDPQKLIEIFIEDCKNIDISLPILTKLEALKDKYYLILATGNMDSLERFTLPHNSKIEQTFDEVHNSYNMKMHKSPEYFNMVLEQKGVDPAQSILLDDSDRNCDKFRQVGGIAHCVYGEDQVLSILDKLIY